MPLIEPYLQTMAEELKEKDILTIGECAQLLRIGKRTMYDLVSDERVPGKIFAKKVGRSWRIMRAEVDRFLQEEEGRPYQLTLRPEEK